MEYKKTKTMVWGGSGIEKCLFDFICDEIPKGSKILEFGAGFCSTNALINEGYELTSIEHDTCYTFINKNTIHAPLVNDWYDLDVIKNNLLISYDLIFIDGYKREKFLENTDLFMPIKKIIVHDTYRCAELGLSYLLAEKLNKQIRIFKDCDHWSYIY